MGVTWSLRQHVTWGISINGYFVASFCIYNILCQTCIRGIQSRYESPLMVELLDSLVSDY